MGILSRAGFAVRGCLPCTVAKDTNFRTRPPVNIFMLRSLMYGNGKNSTCLTVLYSNYFECKTDAQQAQQKRLLSPSSFVSGHGVTM